MSPVTVVDTITAVDCGQWDDLAGDTALATYGWLRTVEECLTIDLTPVYFLLTENQSLRAATVCYRSFRADHIFTLDHMIFGRLRDTAAELSVTFLPVGLGINLAMITCTLGLCALSTSITVPNSSMVPGIDWP